MGETPIANPLKSVFGTLGDALSYVPVIISFVLAILGISAGPFRLTTASLTLLVLSVLLIVYRWPQISKYKQAEASGILVVGEVRRRPSLGFWGRILDPLRTNSLGTYNLSPTRRRFEAVVMFSLTLFSIGLTAIRYPRMVDELLGLKDCVGSNASSALRLVVAEFAETGSQPNLPIEQDLHDALSASLKGENFKVCRFESSSEVISSSVQATNLAERARADIVIWGRRSIAYEVHFEFVGWEPPGMILTYRRAEETSDFNFLQLEPVHLNYLVQFAVSDVLYSLDEIETAQAKLDLALAEAEGDPRNPFEENPKDLAEGYFLKGIFYHPETSPYSDDERSAAAYTRALELNPDRYEASLHRGLVYAHMGETQLAIDDFSELIEQDTPIAADAYVNRSALLPECSDAALADLNEAIKFDPMAYSFRGSFRQNCGDIQSAIEDYQRAVDARPQEYFLYHLLGVAQLEAGQSEDARQTYREMKPHLDQDTKEFVVDDLRTYIDVFPWEREVIEEIIRELEK
jgi:tetratricopeptide (TPR) repeat protein